MLLYDMYAVVSNKTVRKNEKKSHYWINKNEEVPGKMMVKTNRGYFLDGYNIDEKSTDKWFTLTGLPRYRKPKFKKIWKNKK